MAKAKTKGGGAKQSGPQGQAHPKLPDEDEQPAAGGAAADTQAATELDGDGAEPNTGTAEGDAAKETAQDAKPVPMLTYAELSLPLFPASQQLKFRADLGDISQKAARGARLVQGGFMQSGAVDERHRHPDSVPAAITHLLERVADAYDGQTDRQ